MTKKINFVEVAMDACEIIQNKLTISDVDLMIALKFSPPSWRVWKPKLVEKLSNYIMSKIEREEGDKTRMKITFDKKQKLWQAIEFIEDN